MVNNMATDEQLIKEAEYYLNNNVTIEQASIDLNISKRTLQLHLKKLEDIAPATFALVKAKKDANIHKGKIKGGLTGKRGATWTEEDAKRVATLILSQEMTYREAEEKTGIPSSTIHDMVHKGVNPDEGGSLLYALAEANRRGLTLDEFYKQHSLEHVNSDIISKQIQEDNMSSRRK